MKEKILKNKFFIFIISFIFCFSILTTTVYGHTFEDSNGSPHNFTIPEDCVNYIIFRWNEGDYYFLYSKEACYWAVDNARDTNQLNINCYSDENYSTTIPYYRIDAKSNTDFASLTVRSYNTYSSAKEILYSNVGIADKSNNNEIFFPLPLQVTITNLTQVEEIPQMMGKVLKIIIPIGLSLLSIGLVIFLIRWVISRVT